MNGQLRAILALGAALAAGVAPGTAQVGGVLTNKIELEKRVAAADGAAATVQYVTPDTVVPGDRVRVTLTFTNNGTAPAAGVNLVNPIPEALIFDDADESPGFGVSVDGGKNFGTLAALTVRVTGTAPRPAGAADVTHVRWLWPDAVPVGESRTVAFFGRVR